MKSKGRWKRLPRASVSRFLPPPLPQIPTQMHLGIGGRGDCVPKSLENELLTARTQAGQVWKARGAGVGAKHPPTHTQVTGAPPPRTWGVGWD